MRANRRHINARRSLFLANALVYCALSAHAGELAAFCKAAKEIVDANARLGAEIGAVFGKTTFEATAADCLYPLRLVRYASADVLVVEEGEPGHGCHGCSAVLSAYVLQRVNGGFRTAGRFQKFASLGSWGAVSDLYPIEINGDDAMAIESSYASQVFFSEYVDFYAFHTGQLVSINPEPIVVSAGNGGAVDASQAIQVTATWYFDATDKTALIVDYKIEARGASRIERVVWRLQGTSLVRFRGRVPPEISAVLGK